MYLLTFAVHEWWQSLLKNLRSSGFPWKEGWSVEGKEWITLRVSEITSKKAASVDKSKREMLASGETISVDAIIQLSE
jgi:chloramphenicol 3-O-phosphotransferase